MRNELTEHEYTKLLPYKQYIFAAVPGSTLYGDKHHSAWAIMADIWWGMKRARTDGFCPDCVYSMYQNFRDLITIYEKHNGI
jgi:hypothetical protein